MNRTFSAFSFTVLALVVVGLLLAAPAADAKPKLNPIIFVHGGSGSAAQFESQAMRFTSNGYPLSYIRALEYDSSSIGTILPAVLANLDALIAELQALSGQAQVDLLGHSLGTFVSQTYLSTPARAAKVAHYVNIDGASAAAPPGGVPTLALWAGDAPPIGSIAGAINVTLAGQEHVESASSPEAFFEMYSFFRGAALATTDEVEHDQPGYWILTDTFDRHWRAWVDGAPGVIERANLRHRAIWIPAGKHKVRMRYQPRLILALAGAAALLALLLACLVLHPGSRRPAIRPMRT